MSRSLGIAIAALLLVLVPLSLSAQDEKVVYTKNGQKYTGTVLKEDKDLITLKIKGGQVTIPTSIVDKIVDLIEQAKLQLLVVHDKKLATRLHEELRLGRDFTELVKKYSQHLSSFDDGKTDFVDKSYLPAQVANSAFGLAQDTYTSSIKAGDAFYIVKMLEKRKVEKGSPEDAQGSSKGQGTRDKPAEPQDKLIKVAVLPVTESTPEARTAKKGIVVQNLLLTEISATTGLKAMLFETAPPPDDKEAPSFVISGEIAVSGPAAAVQFVLKEKNGKELYTSERLTAVGEKDIEKAVKTLAERLIRLIREIKQPR